MKSEQIVQHWINKGYLTKDGPDLVITALGSRHPAVLLVFDRNNSNIINKLYDIGLVEYVFNSETGEPTYRTTTMGLEWANILKEII